MGLSTMNGRDQNPYQHHLDKPYEPIVMPLEKHIDKHIKKLEDIENIDQLLVLVINMCALLGSQGKIVSRQAMVELLPKIKEKTKISASTWNSHVVYALAGIGSAISIAFGVYSSVKTFEVLSTMPQLEAAARNIAGVVTDVSQQAVQLKIQNLLSHSQTIQGFGSGASQAFKTAQELWQGNLSAERQLTDHDIDLSKFKRDHLQQTSGGQGHKADETIQMAQQLIEKLHQAKKAAN